MAFQFGTNWDVLATRIVTGTDVDYGSLTNHFVGHLSALPGFDVHYLSRVTDFAARRTDAGASKSRTPRAAIGDR